MKSINKQSGLIRLLLLIIIAILILSYFNISIKSLVQKPQTQDNIGYVVSLGSQVWAQYLSKPFLYFWNNIFLGLLWSAFVENMNQAKQGNPPLNFGQPQGQTP